MGCKAAFFDRDNTLCRADERIRTQTRQYISEWAGGAFRFAPDAPGRAFDMACCPPEGLKTVENEKKFYFRYYCALLELSGVTEDIPGRAKRLFELNWCRNAVLFPDTVETLDWFRTNGYLMGVISDTFPSLELTLRGLGIAQYFDCFICSDIVGVMKPEPQIYLAALRAVGASAMDSLYVDDYGVEADGARALGFTAFHIDRTGKDRSEWGITSLLEMVDYAKR